MTHATATTQAEIDAVIGSLVEGDTLHIAENVTGRRVIIREFTPADVLVGNGVKLNALENSFVTALDGSSVAAYDHAVVFAHSGSTVTAQDDVAVKAVGNTKNLYYAGSDDSTLTMVDGTVYDSTFKFVEIVDGVLNAPNLNY